MSVNHKLLCTIVTVKKDVTNYFDTIEYSTQITNDINLGHFTNNAIIYTSQVYDTSNNY